MSKIATPATIADAPTASQPILENIKQAMGSAPNFFRLIANSPSTLEGYVGFSGALSKGALDPATRERIALAVAQINGCNYCLAAHSYVGKNVAKLNDLEMAKNRSGGSLDDKAHVAVRFAVAIVSGRGQVDQDLLAEVKAAGYSDAEIVEIIAHVGLNTLTNYVNDVLKTEIDFPVVADVAA